MTECRFEVKEDTMEDCISVTDNQDNLKNGFDSEFILFPLEDASAIVNELNIQCATVEMLKEQLESYEDPEDVEYWIKEIREDYNDC